MCCYSLKCIFTPPRQGSRIAFGRGLRCINIHVGPSCILIGWKTCCTLELKSNYCIFVLLLLILSVSFYKKAFKKKIMLLF